MEYDAKFWMVHPQHKSCFPNSEIGHTRSNWAIIVWGFGTQVCFIFNNYSIFIFFLYINIQLGLNYTIKNIYKVN